MIKSVIPIGMELLFFSWGVKGTAKISTKLLRSKNSKRIKFENDKTMIKLA